MSQKKDTVREKQSPSGCDAAAEKAGGCRAPTGENGPVHPDRRTFLAGAAGLFGLMAMSSCSWQEFFQNQFERMSKKEIQQTVDRLQAQYKEKYGKDFVVGTEAPIDATLFGYALDIQRCIGCRRCVYACVEENNLSRDPQIQYIRVSDSETET